MNVAPAFFLHQTDHWLLNHHQSSALPGYLMLGAKAPVDSLADMPQAALAELGVLLAKTQRIMEAQLKPKWLYISRFGHMPGFPLHFHFIPVYDWVEALFWQDERYRVLQSFAAPGIDPGLTDGAELILFIWREFGESPTPPAIQGASASEVIQQLCEDFAQPWPTAGAGSQIDC